MELNQLDVIINRTCKENCEYCFYKKATVQRPAENKILPAVCECLRLFPNLKMVNIIGQEPANSLDLMEEIVSLCQGRCNVSLVTNINKIRRYNKKLLNELNLIKASIHESARKEDIEYLRSLQHPRINIGFVRTRKNRWFDWADWKKIPLDWIVTISPEYTLSQFFNFSWYLQLEKEVRNIRPVVVEIWLEKISAKFLKKFCISVIKNKNNISGRFVTSSASGYGIATPEGRYYTSLEDAVLMRNRNFSTLDLLERDTCLV